MVAAKELDIARQRRISLVGTAHKKQYAQYLTPIEIARYMARTAARFWEKTERAAVLDAGAGSGILSCCLVSELLEKHLGISIQLDAYELDKTILGDLDRTYRHMVNGEQLRYAILYKDFIIENCADILNNRAKKYDLIIMNPPYKKINSGSVYRKCLHDAGIETVNAYSAFIAVAIKLLADNGILTAIVPRSFCNGLYFLPFRKFLLENTAILHLHSFESRGNFKDEQVLQENVIITLKKTAKQESEVVISYSRDKPFSSYTEKRLPYSSIVDADDQQRYIAIPSIKEAVRFPLPRLRDGFAFDVSTGPVVDFRMRDKLVFDNPAHGIPLLYPIHLRDRKITWPVLSKKPNAIVLEGGELDKNAFQNGYYVLVKRFSSKEEKRRIYATLLTPDALDAGYFTVENHINIIHRKHGSLDKESAAGLAAYLNTEYCDEQFRAFSGHTQVNATDLRNMKYPAPAILVELGRMAEGRQPEEYDTLLRGLL